MDQETNKGMLDQTHNIVDQQRKHALYADVINYAIRFHLYNEKYVLVPCLAK